MKSAYQWGLVMHFLGLNEPLEKVYRILVKHNSARVDTLVERLGWSDEQVRETLQELVRISLVRPSREVPGEFRAVSPEVGLELLLAQQEADLRRYQQQILDSRVMAARLIAEYGELRQTRNSLDAEHLVGIDTIRLRIEALARTCQSELMAFAAGGAQTPENMAASKPLDRDIVLRGGRLRTIYLNSIVNDTATTEYARWLVRNGGEVRTAATLPLRMAIYDRRLALVPFDPDDSAAGAVLLHGTGVVAALCALFDRVWQTAVQFGKERQRDDHGLTAQEREVLSLLSEGHTDDAIAHKLSVSVRTTRRIIADVMTRLGARSRFQAGARARDRGWVDGP